MTGSDQFNEKKRQNKKVNNNKECGFVVGSDGHSEEVTLRRELNEGGDGEGPHGHLWRTVFQMGQQQVQRPSGRSILWEGLRFGNEARGGRGLDYAGPSRP